MTNLLLSCVVLASCNDHNSPVPASGPFQVAESKALPEVKQPEIEEQNVSGEGMPLESRENNKKAQSIIVKKRVVEFNSNFSNFEEFKNGLNQYLVHAEVKQYEPGMFLLCETQSPTSNKKTFKKEFTRNQTDADVLVDMRGRFEQVEMVNCKIKKNDKVEAESLFTFKKDLLIKGTQDYRQLSLLAGRNELGAVVFDDKAILQSLGDHLNIIAEDLISQNAVVVSFLENANSKASANQNGRSGGIININALRAYGSLVIKMKGQDGGDQTLVPGPVTEVPAADHLLDAVYSKKPELNQYCIADASKGYKGFKGRKGYEGKSGGNSGSAMVNVGDGTDFKFEILLIQGAGGFGGAPGLGGKGSVGGKGRGETYDILCPVKIFSHDGPPGDSGDLGDIGDVGQDGRREKGYYFDAKNNIRIEY